MKIKIILIVISIIGCCLTSCHIYSYKDFEIKDNLWNFADDVIRNPDKIRDIKNNYPDLYDERFISNTFYSTTGDTTYINELINTIKNNFHGNGIKSYKNISIGSLIISTHIYQNGYQYIDEEDYKKSINYNKFKYTDLYGFSIASENKIGIRFTFIKYDNKFYICYFGYYYLESPLNHDHNID
jgi:hypothetical protein